MVLTLLLAFILASSFIYLSFAIYKNQNYPIEARIILSLAFWFAAPFLTPLAFWVLLAHNKIDSFFFLTHSKVDARSA